MKNFFKKFVILISLIAILALPYIVSAASDAYGNLEKMGKDPSSPYQPVSIGTNDLAGIVGIGIQAFLSILGVIFLILIIYAGYGWMMARGEEEKVTKAKDTLTRAVIGLIITIGAYAISYWIIDGLTKTSGILK
ncbi:MAG: hypothetical protein PHF50_00315 [Patescibacteria group bacterium]|nr:hypothetical protein [Patescibacteria group bacterium]